MPMNKFTEEHFWMRRAMRKQVGSFARSLAECLENADMENYSKLQKAFPEYIEKYISIGRDLSNEIDEAKIIRCGGGR